MRFVTLVSLALVLMGCRWLSSGDDANSQAVADIGALGPSEIPESIANREPIEISAWANGPRVRVQLWNSAREGLLVAPGNFALITHDNNLLIVGEEGAVGRFAPIRLTLGESFTGEFIFDVEDTTGCRLVFNSSEIEPHHWAATIQHDR